MAKKKPVPVAVIKRNPRDKLASLKGTPFNEATYFAEHAEKQLKKLRQLYLSLSVEGQELVFTYASVDVKSIVTDT